MNPIPPAANPCKLFARRGPEPYKRRGQFATLTAVNKIPAAYWDRDIVAAGGLMSYGTSASIPAKSSKARRPDLPVLQSTMFEFAINLQTARAFGIEVPSGLLSIADEVIE